MFLENLGKLFFLKIRPIFLFVFISLPLVLTGVYIFSKRLEILRLADRYESTLLKAYQSLEKRARKEKLLARYSKSQPYFLDQNIESLTLLQTEIERLQSYQTHPALFERERVDTRLAFLTGGKNRISFMEETLRTSSLCKETEEKMKKAVEMDEEDLKKILSLIENVSIDKYEPDPKSPQLIISDLSIKKKKSFFEQEIFEVKLDLIKREFNES